MKITFTIPNTVLAALLFPLLLNAQDEIPNPGFEDWSGGEPVGWNTINQSILGTTFTPVTRDMTNPHGGTSCARLETITQNVFLVGPVTMPGVLSLGEIVLDILNMTGTVEGGVPVSGAPVMLRGYYRYQPGLGDSCVIGIGLSRWNGTSRDTLAYSYRTIGGATPSWTEFSVPVEYFIQAEADTMNIMFVSSNLLTGFMTTGSKLWVDDLWLEYGTVSVQETGRSVSLRASPSPEGGRLNVFTPGGGTLQLISISGNVLFSAPVAAGETLTSIPAGNLPPAPYLLRFTGSGGNQQVIKIIIQ